jgi:polyisoprenoid-binding protein YceI
MASKKRCRENTRDSKKPRENPIDKRRLRYVRLTILCLIASALLPSVSRAQAPVFAITPEESTVNFNVKASVAIEGKFEKWDATLTFTSSDVTTGVSDVKIQAATVNSGSGMKDDKLRSKDSLTSSRTH